MKDIVIIADFLGPLNGAFNSRFLYLADMLADNNHVEIISSDFDHGSKEYFHHEIEKHNYPITLLHEVAYPKNVCMKRFFGHFIWGRNVSKYLRRRKKPDVIYCAIPTLQASYEAAKYCEKNGIRFIIDIQDLWPEAFQMVFRVPVLSDVVFAPFKRRADEIYKTADVVCGVSQRYVDRAMSVNQKCKSSHAVFLGTSLATFEQYAKSVDPIVRKDAKEIWLGYCGSLAASYDIPCVISALKILKDRGIKFLRLIIIGDGARRNEFEIEVKNAGINALFLGFLPYYQMCAQLVQCDIVVNPIVKGSAASIINKHGDYASSGLPVLNTQDSPEYRALIEEYNMGLNCENGNAKDLAEKIMRLVENPALRKEMGKNARRCAEEKFDRGCSYKELINCILE